MKASGGSAPLFAATLLLLGLAALPWLLGPGKAIASHPDMEQWPRRHNWLIHHRSSGHGENDEDYCVYSDGTLSTDTVKSRMWSTLVLSSPKWDGLQNYMVDVWAAPGTCFDNDWSWIELRVFVYDNNATSPSPCTDTDDTSCVHHVDPYGSHYLYEFMDLDTHNIDGGASEYKRNMNHEFGHFLGLLDPSSTGDCANGTSVMHQYAYYGCSQSVQYPQPNDLSSVGNIIWFVTGYH